MLFTWMVPRCYKRQHCGQDRSEWKEEETYLASLLETRAQDIAVAGTAAECHSLKSTLVSPCPQEPWNKLGTPFRQPDTREPQILVPVP